jgi:subtilisin family serine protease
MPAAWDLSLFNTYWPLDTAILDTGINWSHPDIQGEVLIPSDRYGNCISPWNYPMDDNGHGTHVAGIAGAMINNSIGIAGISPLSLVAVKVLGQNGEGTWDSAACGVGIAAAIPAVKVINMSLSGPGGSSTLYNAIYSAWVYYGKTVVAANGNLGGTVPSPDRYPACYSRNGIVIAVGATDYYNNRASYSSANDCITVSAPGDSILSTYSTNYSTADSYAYLSGTSMAAPHVSGVVSSMQRYHVRSNNNVRNLLTQTAQNLGSPSWDIYTGWGLINAYGAVSGGSGVNALQPGESLAPGQSRTSTDGRFFLIYQGDGNLVLYQNGVGALWSSGTAGTSPGVTVMQTDGNLVVYDAVWSPVWHTYTYNNPGAWLVVQNDGNVVVYGDNGWALWATGTCCR